LIVFFDLRSFREKTGWRIERKHKNRNVEEVLGRWWWGGVWLRGIGGGDSC
jgi:hypothetical protein